MADAEARGGWGGGRGACAEHGGGMIGHGGGMVGHGKVRERRAEVDIVAVGELERGAAHDPFSHGVVGVGLRRKGFGGRVGEGQPFDEAHPVALHDPLHVDARGVHGVGVELSSRHKLLHLCDRHAPSSCDSRVVIARLPPTRSRAASASERQCWQAGRQAGTYRLPVDEIALRVALPRLDQRKVAAQRVLHDILARFGAIVAREWLSKVLRGARRRARRDSSRTIGSISRRHAAVLHERACAGARKEGRDARARRTHPFGQRAHRHKLDLVRLGLGLGLGLAIQVLLLEDLVLTSTSPFKYCCSKILFSPT